MVGFDYLEGFFDLEEETVARAAQTSSKAIGSAMLGALSEVLEGLFKPCCVSTCEGQAGFGFWCQEPAGGR